MIGQEIDAADQCYTATHFEFEPSVDCGGTPGASLPECVPQSGPQGDPLPDYASILAESVHCADYDGAAVSRVGMDSGARCILTQTQGEVSPNEGGMGWIGDDLYLCAATVWRISLLDGSATDSGTSCAMVTDYDGQILVRPEPFGGVYGYQDVVVYSDFAALQADAPSAISHCEALAARRAGGREVLPRELTVLPRGSALARTSIECAREREVTPRLREDITTAIQDRDRALEYLARLARHTIPEHRVAELGQGTAEVRVVRAQAPLTSGLRQATAARERGRSPRTLRARCRDCGGGRRPRWSRHPSPGGETSSVLNRDPDYDIMIDFQPNLENAEVQGGGFALLVNTGAASDPTAIPVDAVIYGLDNAGNLVDETGAVPGAPCVASPGPGGSIQRIDAAHGWQTAAVPTRVERRMDHRRVHLAASRDHGRLTRPSRSKTRESRSPEK